MTSYLHVQIPSSTHIFLHYFITCSASTITITGNGDNISLQLSPITLSLIVFVLINNLILNFEKVLMGHTHFLCNLDLACLFEPEIKNGCFLGRPRSQEDLKHGVVYEYNTLLS